MNNEHFKISAYLKNIIGKELITDEFVAVFELVKNSFDANATDVKIIFENQNDSEPAKLIISDNGKGMNYEELKDKWLFVAYSAKKDGTEFDDYRNKIKATRYFAGAKGVGRFSCDRLGSKLKLITVKDETNPKIENLIVNWDEFEKDAKEEFVDVSVKHQVLSSIKYNIKHGTILEISGLRDIWNRDRILKLKKSLVKLINPNQKNDSDNFSIEIIAKSEKELDGRLIKEGKNNFEIVNGKIENKLFETLQIKTTNIKVWITKDGEKINSELWDRGDLIYKITENNPFSHLYNIKTYLFQLNRSAKVTFTRLMGMHAIEYGSVFMYKNGFRIYPFGEDRDDTLGIDRRKSQGHNRYLGARDLIGRIEINGNNSELRETSSRDGGLLKTQAYNELVSFFYDFALKRLERYAVEVIRWGDERIDTETGEVLPVITSKDVKVRILNDSKNLLSIGITSLQQKVNQEVIGFIKWLAIEPKYIEAIDYDKDFFKIVEQKQDKSTTKTIQQVEKKAEKINDRELIKSVKKIKKDFKQIQQAKKEAEKEVQETKKEKEKTEKKLEEKEKETLFLREAIGEDSKELQSLNHHITHTSKDIASLVDTLIDFVKERKSEKDLLRIISKIDLKNLEISTLSQFVTKAKFNTKNKTIPANIVLFTSEYLSNVYDTKKILKKDFKIISKTNNLSFDLKIKPIQLIIIINNLISNAEKARANQIIFEWKYFNNDEIILSVMDNGVGIKDNIIDRIFDFRFTTTNGSGLGLYHTKDIIKSLKGEIFVNNKLEKGTEFIIKFKKNKI